MVRKSLLTPALKRQEPAAAPTVVPAPVKASRTGKRHVGAYFERKDPAIIALDKLGIDLDKNLQDMLYEAIQDYVAKHKAESAFR